MSEQNPEQPTDEQTQQAGQQTSTGDYRPRRRRTATATATETTGDTGDSSTDDAGASGPVSDSYGGNYIDFAAQEPVRDRGDEQPAQYSWGTDDEGDKDKNA